ncbi:MAG: Camelysin metallo-endopeptidase, partial [Blastococcus sp.]|nr:Camelysin metallo-endopeptidase [Blastococcus sp.]
MNAKNIAASSTARKVVGSLGVIGAAAAVAGMGTFGTFTD